MTIRRTRPALAGLALAAGLTGLLAPTSAPASAAAPDPTTNPAFGAGAYLVRDTAPGFTSGAGWSSSGPTDAAVVSGTAYFSASDGSHGQELWATDGTRAGTRMVKDLVAGPAGSTPDQFIVLGKNVLFTATTESGDELWITNGTTAGTHLVKDVGGATLSGDPRGFTRVGTKVWFTAETRLGNNDPSGRELFVTDGQAAGTKLVRDIAPGGESSSPRSITETADGRVVFYASDKGGNTELWTSDGTASGTVEVRDLNAKPEASVFDRIVRLPNGTAVFVGNDGSGRGLWRTDGTDAGTVQVDGSFGAPTDPTQLTVLGDQVVFRGVTAATGYELFHSDGTKAGTGLAADLVPSTGAGNPDRLGVAGGAVWFQASTAPGRTELWSWRPGTTATMRGVLATGGAGSFLTGIADVNGRPVFSADPTGAGTGSELYTVDATGIRLVADLDGAASSSPSLPITLGATALWTADSDALGRELFAWNTQPTTTKLVAERRYPAHQARSRSIRVRVTVVGGPVALSGPVQLRDGTRLVGTGTVADGVATVRITKRLAPGTHRLQARFTGSTTGRASTSPVVRVVVARRR
jgi:ELWxxDGT repeat protein